MSKTTLRKGKQDDKFSLAIRDIQASGAANKRCFDCDQRGPTYINTTIGSFVCTKCSGMLRGINPPHRIKSISMSSFSADEVEMMRGRGNAWCSAVWLGLFDAQPIDYRDDEKIKEFIVAKYEKKRYYVEPSAAQLPRASGGARAGGAPPAPEAQASARGGLASGALIGSTLKARMDPSAQVNISVSRPGAAPRAPEPPRPSSNGAQAPKAAAQAPQPVVFTPPVPAAAPQPAAAPPAPAADFGNFANFDTAAFDSLPADPLPSQPPAAAKQEDKYSALAELDDLFKASAIQESVFPEAPPPEPAPALPAAPSELFQSLLETQGGLQHAPLSAFPAAQPSVFGGDLGGLGERQGSPIPPPGTSPPPPTPPTPSAPRPPTPP